MDIEELERLSLISRVMQELSNHVGVSDKTLAEFIIDRNKNSRSVAEFKNTLNALDAGLSDSFMENLDRLIVKMLPGHPRKEKKIKVEEEEQKQVFKGLALPDQVRDWDVEEERARRNKLDTTEMDKTVGDLIGLDKAIKSERPRKRERSASSSESTSKSR